MNSLWWLALAVLALPIWWHRQRRERVKAQPLATARFLARADPRQLRVWQWADRILLLLRCLILAAMIALLAGLVLPWRGDSVLVAAGTDAAWAEREIREAGFGDARRIGLPTADALGWLQVHEREWQADARLLVVGQLPMPAAQPRFRHRVELRSAAAPVAKSEHRIVIASKRADQWRALFAALDGPRRFVVDASADGKAELVIWDLPDAPPGRLRAPLWWIGDATAFPELEKALALDGLRYADSPRGRLWADSTWPPADADSARAAFERWQRLHYEPVAFTAPSQVLAARPSAPFAGGGGALRDFLTALLAALFALERILTHAQRR
jgi:hypothetical protein